MQSFPQRLQTAKISVSEDCVPAAQSIVKQYEELLNEVATNGFDKDKLPSFFVEFFNNYYSDLKGTELKKTALPILWIGEFLEDGPIFGLVYSGELFSCGVISESQRIEYGLPEGIANYEEYKLFVIELMKAIDGKKALLGTTIKVELPNDSFPREYVVIGAEQEHLRNGVFSTVAGLGADTITNVMGSKADKIWHRFHQTTEPYVFVERNAFERSINRTVPN